MVHSGQHIISVLYRYRIVVALALHIVAITLANGAAFWLRFDGLTPPEQKPYDTALIPMLIAIRLLVFIPFRLHQGIWRYASVWDLRNIMAAVAVSTIMFWVVTHFALGLTVYPRSVFVIDSMLLVCLLGGGRMARRVYREFGGSAKGRRVLIYGAGDAGEMLVRDMRHNNEFGAQPVGFVDDDYRKQGQRIHGVPVLGPSEKVAAIIEQTGAQEVLIAIPSATPKVLRDIVHHLQPFKVRISTVPRLSDLVGRRVGVRQIRDLKVEDLLAREPVTLDYGPVREILKNKRVLVTGAGGSIGSELCRQIAEADPELLVLLDRYENTLYQTHNELTGRHSSVRIACIVGDVTDTRRVDKVIGMCRPSVIFHAAAHKHVPMMEHNPCEAIKNNVRGTRIVAQAAIHWGVERFVLISTDKAVNPTSVMGAAKRIAELIVRSLDNVNGTRLVVVRFGNVLGSNGSVVPRFISQIAAGGPVTVTHPDMRRYFMLIPEAVQLVLHAAAIKAGSVFVLDMGEQIRVAEMARNMIRLSGFIPEQEIAVEYTGIRPGEKLIEELVAPDEVAVPSPVAKIMKIEIRQPATDMNFAKAIMALEEAAIDSDDDAVVEQLNRILPSFRPLPGVMAQYG